MACPKVSIIVPMYCAEKYLNTCIDSLIGQTLSDIEIILVDDGSPDSCGKIADEYATKDPRIKVIHQKNSGQVVTESNSFFRIHSGDDKTQILNHLQSVENAITNENGIDAVTHKHFSEIIDVDSWVKKYLIEEVFGNIDAGHASQFYYWDLFTEI